MVRICLIGLIGSQVLIEIDYENAVHRLNVGGQTIRFLSRNIQVGLLLKIKSVPPERVLQEEAV